MPDVEFFKALENGFARLLREIGGDWTPAEVAEVQGYLDAGEYGLALETLASIAVEESKPVSPDELSAVDDLANRMGMQASAAVCRLRAYAAGRKA